MIHQSRLDLGLAAAALLASTSLAGGVSTFEVQSDGTGTVRTYDEAVGTLLASPPELQGLTLLPLEVNARSAVLEFLPTSTRLRTDVPGAARAVLPGNRGSLYHYSRLAPDGSTWFGFFQVAADGSARSLHELPGVGPGGVNDPFLPRIACAPDGGAFLVATTVPAGGNVLEVVLSATVQVIDRTANLPPRRFYPQSLLLAPTWGTLGLRRAIFRFDRAPTAQASPLDFGALRAPRIFTGNIALSQNGDHAIATAGTSPTTLDAYVFGATGPASLGTPASAALSGAGYLPEADDGPHLAVTDDGLTCAWRTEGVSRECWIGRVQAPPTDPPSELSANGRFLDTLDEVGVFVFHGPTRLQFAVGAQPTPGVSSLESTDLFQADVNGSLGAAQFVNLSNTSGDPTVPFLSVPSISLMRSALMATTGDTWYANDDSHGASVGVVRPNQTGASLVLQDLRAVLDWEFASGWVWLHVRSDLGSRPFELYRVPVDLSTAPILVATDDNADFSRIAARSDGRIAWIRGLSGSSTLSSTSMPTGTTQTLVGTSSFGPTLTYTPAGAVAFTRSGAGGLPSFEVWNPGSAPVPLLVVGAVGGFVLPIGP